MNKIIPLVFIFLNLIVFDSIGQFKKRPFKEVSIVLKKGDTLYGWGKMNHLQEELKFKEKIEDQPLIFSFHDFKEITFYGEKKERYVFIISQLNKYSFPKRNLVRPLQKGRVDLFITGGLYDANIYLANGSAMQVPANNTRYYLRKQDQRAVNLGRPSTYSKKFKKFASDYFDDCPDLLNKISSKYFSRFDIEAIVTYYNQCQQTK